MKKKKINLKKLIIIMLILLTVLLTLMILRLKARTYKETFNYIYSEDMDEGTFSPEMIHLVIAAYEGDENPKAITKATYNFITNLIPKYLNECVRENNIESYFENNKEQIYLLTGINNKDDFNKLIQEIKKLSGDLQFEYAQFDRETIKKNNNNLTVELKIKYLNQEEISVNLKINNKVNSSNPTIKFYK